MFKKLITTLIVCAMLCSTAFALSDLNPEEIIAVNANAAKEVDLSYCDSSSALYDNVGINYQEIWKFIYLMEKQKDKIINEMLQKQKEKEEQEKLELEIQMKEQEKQEALEALIATYNIYNSDIYFIDTDTEYTEEEKQLLAQCLYCEAGSTSWEAQVATFSAILNHIDDYDGLWVLDSVNHFAVAPYYRYCSPLQVQYDVVDYVLSGHRIADIKYFRTSHYHNFGSPMFSIENIYFSK